MYQLIVFVFIVFTSNIDCRGAGPPGSSNNRPFHNGAPGSIGGPGAQLVFPPNPDFGNIMQIDDLPEANRKHIFSDPRGPLGIIDENGQYVPLRDNRGELRSKDTPQNPRDHVEETDWHRVDTAQTRNRVSGNIIPDQQQRDTDHSRAGILYNMMNSGRRRQPGPQGPPRA